MSQTASKTQSAPQTDQELQDQLNERAEAFTKNFANVGYESGHGQNFVRELCGVYGLNYLRSVDFERRVSVLWQPLFEQGLHIHFAHRTFKWSNEGSGVAAVHCVIVGFGMEKPKKCDLWDYTARVAGDGKLNKTRRINAYLVDAPSVWISKVRKPFCKVPEMSRGSQPTDGGYLLLNDEEKQTLLNDEPNAKKWVKSFVMGEEFINNKPRFCLWLDGISQTELDALPLVKQRVEAVKIERLKSTKFATQKSAEQAHLFQEIRQPKAKYLGVPRVSSERRAFIPIGFLDSSVIAGDKIQTVENATNYHFGVLNSTMHNAWMRAVCGRMKSDYSYSNTIVYNNYPWPKASKAHMAAIESAAQGVLDARALHKDKSLAWLYNPETMPKNLQTAHDLVDEAVDEAYGYDKGNDDTSRVAYLFELYEKLNAVKASAVAKKITKRNPKL